LAHEALGAAVNPRDEARAVNFPRVGVDGDEGDERRVEPPPRVDRVEARDDQVELRVPLGGAPRQIPHVRGDGQPRHARADVGGGDGRLGLPHVGRSKEELAVEVGHVNRVHVNDVEAAKAGERQILEQLTPEAPGANDEDADVIVERRQHVRRVGGGKVGGCRRAGAGEEPPRV